MKTSPTLLATLALAFAAPVTNAAKFKNIGYFMEWGTYERNFHPFDLDWDRYTHINYAFGKPNPNGTVSLFDAEAAVNHRYLDHGDPNNTDTTNAYGNFGQINKLKRQFRNTRFGLSIGGWTLSDQFSGIASTETGRRTFAKSSVDLMLDLGLDFIDLDWEYPVEGGNDQPPVPHRPDDIKNYVALLKAIRDEYKRVPFKAELSVASPAGPSYYSHWDFPSICGQLDHINIMTYDFSGSWNTVVDHMANLYPDPNNPSGEGFSAHGAVQAYIQGGCPSEKIVLGVPLYGYSFEGTTGLYGKFTQPTVGSWKDSLGTWDYKDLPQQGATEYFDDVTKAAYSYDAAKKIWTSYDSPKSFAAKLAYIKQYNLGGTMYWASDADAKAGSARSLVTQAYNFYGQANMAFSTNNLDYPTSHYVNIRNGAGPSPPTTTPTLAPPISTP
ncbi:hypothetical protein As57867_014575, partial [Aphanomyces stellatus]